MEREYRPLTKIWVFLLFKIGGTFPVFAHSGAGISEGLRALIT